MNFLAPFFLIAGAAVALPILFHLMRRTPQGKQVFGSVMFLSPSPPRMTKRSRIEDWLLLLLRGLAFCLLAIAFARPFLRAQDQVTDPAEPRQRIVILLDTSASMQQSGFWEQALAAVHEVTDPLKEHDEVALVEFNEGPREIITFHQWNTGPYGSRKALLEERLVAIKPAWGVTNLGDALIFAADELESDTASSTATKLVVLISDLQAGSRWQSLQGANWPPHLAVRLKQIKSRFPGGNAAVQPVQDDQGEGDGIRLRISNTPDSRRSSFTLHWCHIESGNPLPQEQAAATVLVPPGESQVIRLAMPAGTSPAGAIVLKGDDVPFDNTCYISQSRMQNVDVVFLGPELEQATPQSLQFFLNPMFPTTPRRQVQIVQWKPEENAPPIQKNSSPFLIVGTTPTPPQLEWMRHRVAQGGQLLYVAQTPEQAEEIYPLLQLPKFTVKEAASTDYAMIRSIDFAHPVFSIFNDPRFSDFTKARVWHHRIFNTESLPGSNVLARLDDDAPLLCEIPHGRGRVFLLTSGWNRDDSDLAVWSKFIPLMNGLLEYALAAPHQSERRHVGETLNLASLGLPGPTAGFTLVNRTNPSARTSPTTAHAALKIFPKNMEVSTAAPFLITEPGVYQFAEFPVDPKAPPAVTVAVNLDPEESKTEPLALDLLEAAGLRWASELAGPEDRQSRLSEQRRQMMNEELEGHQKLWQFFLIAALLALIAESWLAQRRTRARVAV
ncbi:BatA domain-containing protein [Planctomicrobium sp. SH664]|uniref:BatA domain-containing protein n=1 Tax=Planctomicrobium sp. SH664 TaxID=3448125 RepID=UPI003F5B7E68